MVVSDQVVEVTVEDLSDPQAIVASDMVIGNGADDEIQDIVFVRPDKFSHIAHPCYRSRVGVDKPRTAGAAPAIPADWIRPLGEFPSYRSASPSIGARFPGRGRSSRRRCQR